MKENLQIIIDNQVIIAEKLDNIALTCVLYSICICICICIGGVAIIMRCTCKTKNHE